MAYRSFVGVPNVVLMNNMACHIYRKIKFGDYTAHPANSLNFVSQTSQPAIEFNGPDQLAQSNTTMRVKKLDLEQVVTGEMLSECRYSVTNPLESSAV